jgi:putative Mn2+ efflux pump MntP
MLSIILVAVSLSMDTFSLSLCLGTLNLRYRKILLFSIIVGLFHFIMPLIGITLGDFILEFIKIDTKYITFIIFFLLGIFMLFDKEDNDRKLVTTLPSLLIMGLLVSIDAFVAGVGINLISNKHLLCCSTFSLFSFLFTLTG